MIVLFYVRKKTANKTGMDEMSYELRDVYKVFKA